MEIVFSKKLSQKKHNIFLRKIGNYNIHHTESLLNYHFNTLDIIDKSFFVLEGEEVLAFCPFRNFKSKWYK